VFVRSAFKKYLQYALVICCLWPRLGWFI